MSLHQNIINPGICLIIFTNHAWLPLLQLTGGYKGIEEGRYYKEFITLRAESKEVIFN